MCCLQERADPDSSLGRKKKKKLKPLLKSFLACCNWDQLFWEANSPYLSLFQQPIKGQAYKDRTCFWGRTTEPVEKTSRSSQVSVITYIPLRSGAIPSCTLWGLYTDLCQRPRLKWSRRLMSKRSDGNTCNSNEPNHGNHGGSITVILQTPDNYKRNRMRDPFDISHDIGSSSHQKRKLGSRHLPALLTNPSTILYV